MPLADAGHFDRLGRPDSDALLRMGPTLRVSVSHRVPSARMGEVQPCIVEALIDTGATQSCIDLRLAESLRLDVVGMTEIFGVGGPETHNVYSATISVDALRISQIGEFAGVKLSDTNPRHAVLLGRSFLENVVLIYDGRRAQITLAA